MSDHEDELNDKNVKPIVTILDDCDKNNFVIKEVNHDTDPIIIDCICRICCEEWGGDLNQRRERLLNDYDNGYVFLNNTVVYGYGNMKKGIISSSRDQDMGNETKIAILYSIIISSSYRGLGLGSIMMKLLENEAKRLNYYYLYLYTYNASGFYEKLHYHKCEAIAAYKPVLFNYMNERKLDAIENILLKRLSSSDNINIHEKYIWYRKRLRYSLDFKIIDNSTICKQINDKHYKYICKKKYFKLFYCLYLHCLQPCFRRLCTHTL